MHLNASVEQQSEFDRTWYKTIYFSHFPTDPKLMGNKQTFCPTLKALCGWLSMFDPLDKSALCTVNTWHSSFIHFNLQELVSDRKLQDVDSQLDPLS